MGWLPLIHENCTRMTEYEYQTAEQREANNLNLGGSYHIYSGGGYELRMKGQIKKLNNKIKRGRKLSFLRESLSKRLKGDIAY